MKKQLLVLCPLMLFTSLGYNSISSAQPQQNQNSDCPTCNSKQGNSQIENNNSNFGDQTPATNSNNENFDNGSSNGSQPAPVMQTPATPGQEDTYDYSNENGNTDEN